MEREVEEEAEERRLDLEPAQPPFPVGREKEAKRAATKNLIYLVKKGLKETTADKLN